MPRDGSGIYSKASASFAANATITSASMNANFDDLVTDANAARPVTAGGTGGQSAIAGHDGLVVAGSQVASASTVNLDTATGPLVDITGTTAVTAVTLGTGKLRIVRAIGAFQITASATLVVNKSTSTNYTTSAGDLLVFEGYGSSTVYVWVVGFAASVDVGTAIHALTGKATPVDADEMGLSDSAAASVGKKATYLQAWTNYFKAKADALYQPLRTILTTLGNLANAAGALTNDGSGGLSWVAAAATGQPIPTSSAYAVGTVVSGTQVSGSSVADGSTVAGSNLRGFAPASASGNNAVWTSQSGTWKNVSGIAVGTGSVGGIWVRTV